MGQSQGEERRALTSKDRRALFLEMADRPEGVSPLEVYNRAVDMGDTATEEAYYNLARRLLHRGLIASAPSGHGARYKLGAFSDSQWLEEDQLGSLVDPEYPLLAITIWRESQRQIHAIPEEVWIELRNRMSQQPARELFFQAIVSYSSDLHAQISDLAQMSDSPTPELPSLRQEAENSRLLMLGLAKYGLGLSKEAVDVPLNIDAAIADIKSKPSYVNETLLREELARRIAPESFVVDIAATFPDKQFLIGAVDGSTRSGILSFLGEGGDLGVGHAPMIAINTSVGQVNRSLQEKRRSIPIFTRLPEKPEDMQRQDNRYTVMAKLLHPDLSDAEYMHSVWNAMDLIEAKAALRLLDRWYGPRPELEVPPSDVVLRDGTVAPQDRDFNHYAALSSYGQIVRDMIGTNWKIAAKCRDDGQTLAGVVKMAQLSVFGPIFNWFAGQVAREKTGQLVAWPMQSMNLVPDQILMTRLLTAGRGKRDSWTRTCFVLRPFQATTNYARTYSRVNPPSSVILALHKAAMENPDEVDQEKRIFWQSFRPESDPYLRMLDHVFYCSFFLGAVPRLDLEKNLPRLEVLVTSPTDEGKEDPAVPALNHVNRLIAALHQNGFEVSAEHNMFQDKAKLDILPALAIKVHDTVKHWAAELISRVQEYVGYLLARHVNTKKLRGVRVRPFTRSELELLYSQLKQERELQAGAPPTKRIEGPEK
jgi:hypothetical protein